MKPIPEYLKSFIVEQDYSKYTAIDHATWRFIMHRARKFFSQHAHAKYLDGLEKTGISIERIPRIEEMDAKLRKFGWRAVAISGFIPPSVFLEFESLGILGIACDMRALEHMAYTPAPDIVHEAAGHAPMIADPEYSAYLLRYGEIARKAIFSDEDMAVYEAIRNLSEIKEDPAATPAEIAAAQTRLDQANASVSYTSEATLLARMAWWTTEYGLIGSLQNPLIYGAGLLSSIGESANCLSESVQKIPMSLDCIHTSYDITRPQPQLFVTPSFKYLGEVLEEFSETMAYRRGGIEGLAKAKRSKSVTTTVFDSGIQIGGKLTSVLTDSNGVPVYLRYTGPTQLAFEDQQIENQGADYHVHGFGTPVGKVAKLNKSPAELTDAELKDLGFHPGKKGTLNFQSGVHVSGMLTGKVQRGGKNLLLVFESCTVTLDDQVLFDPAWGTFDMTCGQSVVSVFGDAPDRAAYLKSIGGFKQKVGKQKSNITEQNRDLIPLYAELRELRESNSVTLKDLERIFDILEKRFPNDWLLRHEILELAPTDSALAKKVPATIPANFPKFE